eukprot:SAG31_NODE_10226_length_1168_cov_0.909261_2_plen_152_part_00
MRSPGARSAVEVAREILSPHTAASGPRGAVLLSAHQSPTQLRFRSLESAWGMSRGTQQLSPAFAESDAGSDTPAKSQEQLIGGPQAAAGQRMPLSRPTMERDIDMHAARQPASSGGAAVMELTDLLGAFEAFDLVSRVACAARRAVPANRH